MKKTLNYLVVLIFGRKKPDLKKSSESEMLNYCLSLAQEWGPNWMKRIDKSLIKLYPNISVDRVKYYTDISDEAMKFGYDLTSRLIDSHGEKGARLIFKEKLLEKYIWIDDNNVSHLFSTGTYYHFK